MLEKVVGKPQSTVYTSDLGRLSLVLLKQELSQLERSRILQVVEMVSRNLGHLREHLAVEAKKFNHHLRTALEAWSYHTLATAVLPYSSAGPKPLALEEILRQNDSSHDSNDKWRFTVSSHSGVPSRRIESPC
uniref:Uncharacterized protein n=1 Tax=Vespula pensylvanica TaxID=30213 RepID=A0A834UAT9_VESPE|nr:hypothetical protein H0235_006930 [Vespula pensylvanica]